MPRPRTSYSHAGVNLGQVSKSHRIVARKLAVTFQTRKGKLGRPIFPIGHYAGLVDVGNNRVLSLHTDSVGTKVLIARMMGKYDTIGIDCVAMCANDIICTGSEPISFLDYLAVSKPNPTMVASIAEGIVVGAKQAGLAVVGGETAVVPDLLSEAGIDLVGMAAGICSKGDLVLGDRIRNGDELIGVASSGIHSNGLTLARKVLLKNHPVREVIPDLERSIGEELLEPTRIYVKPVLETLKQAEVHGLAHITGGGFSKLNRIVSQAKLGADLDYMPTPPVIFRMLQSEGRIAEAEMFRTFNMGIGFVVICPEGQSAAVFRVFRRHKQGAFRIGSVQKTRGIRIFGRLVSN